MPRALGNGWLNLQIFADLTIHLRLAFSPQFATQFLNSRTFISGLILWSRRAVNTDWGFNISMAERSAGGNTGPQLTQVKLKHL